MLEELFKNILDSDVVKKVTKNLGENEIVNKVKEAVAGNDYAKKLQEGLTSGALLDKIKTGAQTAGREATKVSLECYQVMTAETTPTVDKGGQLHIRAIGKTSWVDSRYEDEWIASDDEVHRFLYAHQYEMDTSEVE